MHNAILERKNGQYIFLKVHEELDIFFYPLPQIVNPYIEEFIDLTPDNIINKSGFSQIEKLEDYKLKFELILRTQCKDVRTLHYREI